MDKVWYYRVNGQKQGPFSESEIVKFIMDGTLGSEDEIWMKDLHYCVVLLFAINRYVI